MDWIGLWNLGFKPAPGQQRPFSTLTNRVSLREWIARTKRADEKRDISRTTRLVAAGGRRDAVKTLIVLGNINMDKACVSTNLPLQKFNLFCRSWIIGLIHWKISNFTLLVQL